MSGATGPKATARPSGDAAPLQRPAPGDETRVGKGRGLETAVSQRTADDALQAVYRLLIERGAENEPG